MSLLSKLFRKKKKWKDSALTISEVYYNPEELRQVRAYRRGMREEWEFRQSEIDQFDEWQMKRKAEQKETYSIL